MRLNLDPDVNAPSRARAHVAAQLVSSRVSDELLADKVVLIASELVTNAVQAGATAIQVELRLADRRVDLVVTDDAQGWPTPASASTDDTAGRGLGIVDQLTDAWEVARRRRGKAVTASWFVDSDQRTAADS